jgi:hypothetical protein
MVSESGLKLYAGNEKESCEGGNIKASYGSVSYLARKLNHLLHCIGKKRKIAEKKWNRRLSPIFLITKLSSILLYTDNNHHEKPAD